MNKVFILVIDGCAPEYITPECAPNIHRLAQQFGFAKTVKAVVPTVTNVNHASILSGKFPSETGMVGNYYYNTATGEEGFIEEKGFMKAETLLQAYRRRGLKTAFLTVKGKLLGVYGHAADIGISVQTPDEAQLKKYGLPAPPAVSSLESSQWIVNAALRVIQQEDPALVYCTTNDFGFHHFGPEAPEAQLQIRQIDEAIAAIHAADPERQIYITADHGMNQKHQLLDFQQLADEAGLHIFCLAPLKDRYRENHVYQEGGILYLFLKKPEEKEALLELIKTRPEIEAAMTNKEAAEKLHLPLQGIGDYVVFTAPDCAFGELGGAVTLVTNESRTHGSLYEQEVPLIAIHPAAPAEAYRYSKDIAAVLSAECRFCGYRNADVNVAKYGTIDCKNAGLSLWTTLFPLIFGVTFGFIGFILPILVDPSQRGDFPLRLICTPFAVISVVAWGIILYTLYKHILVTGKGKEITGTVYGYKDGTINYNHRPGQVCKILIDTREGKKFIFYPIPGTKKPYPVNSKLKLKAYQNYFMVLENKNGDPF